MRRLLPLVLLLFSTLLMADKVHWANNFKSGVAQAQKEYKPIVFVFSKHTCYYCNLLKETTLSDKRIVRALNRDFIPIIAYDDSDDYIPIELWKPITPVIWFLQPNGTPMADPVIGAVGAEEFLQDLAIVKTGFDKYKKAHKK